MKVYSPHWAIALEAVVVKVIPGRSRLGSSSRDADVETGQTLSSPTAGTLGYSMDHAQSIPVQWWGQRKAFSWSLFHKVPPLH